MRPKKTPDILQSHFETEIDSEYRACAGGAKQRDEPQHGGRHDRLTGDSRYDRCDTFLVRLKASLRPTRLVNACLLTMPKLIAAITGKHRITGTNQGLRGHRWLEQGKKSEADPPRTTMLAVATIRARFQTVPVDERSSWCAGCDDYDSRGRHDNADMRRAPLLG